MGFRPEPTVFKLNFEGDDQMKGCFVRVKGVSIAEFNEMSSVQGSAEDVNASNVVDKMNERDKKLQKRFLELVVEWNLEDEQGNPLPVTMEAFGGLDKLAGNKIVAAWLMALVVVPAPLQKGSEDGETSQEPSTTALENSFQSHPNWPQQNPS